MKYVVVMKSPGMGPIVATGVRTQYKYGDREKFNKLQDSAARKLKNLTGEDPVWDKKKLLFHVEMTEDQAKEMKNWIGVKMVVPLDVFLKKR